MVKLSSATGGSTMWASTTIVPFSSRYLHHIVYLRNSTSTTSEQFFYGFSFL